MPRKSASDVFDLRNYKYYEFGNTFTGSRGDFNFKIVPDKKENKFTLSIWYGRLCSDLAQIETEKTWEFSSDGFDEMIAFLDKTALDYEKNEN